MVEFEQTPERMGIVAALDELEAKAKAAYEMVSTAGYRVRAHKLLNAAQEVASQRSLLSMDWHDEDIRRRNAA